MCTYDCIVVGGGQSGLATGYYLRRQKLDFLILDANDSPGGAWQHVWDSLTLFSDAQSSTLPGWPMPSYPGFPPASHVVDYLTRYEQRYDLPVRHGVAVERVLDDAPFFRLLTTHGEFRSRTVVAATGTWSAPFIPFYPGEFQGRQWHTASYTGPNPFLDSTNSGHTSRVAVVGAGNSGAQIAAELALAGVDTAWFTTHPPRWMPDDVDGRVLFARNRQRMLAKLRGEPDPGPETELGDIVMVPPVLKARDCGLLRATDMFSSLDELNREGFSDLIWATGFRPALRPFPGLLAEGKPTVEGFFPVGYGTWTGPGSATITGVSPYARQVAADVAKLVRSSR
ncbi:NAD(P)-binding domain-containing protein [Corynebacterium aurimucosum]|uniref:NAD(P)-binding domain-containing protein n=1 Tax=Corynebacterium aurimucosum TaxID=169292 RepID=UPI003990AE06